MKKLLLTVVAACSLMTVQAQEGVRLGVKGSFNSTWLFNKNVSDQNDKLDYASSFGTSFGAQAIFMFTETYGMSAEMIFSKHVQKYDGYVFTDTKPFTNELSLNYLDIPVLFRVSSAKGPFFEIGPQVSLLTGAKETYSGQESGANNYSDKDFKSNFNGFGVAGVLGFGIDIKLNDAFALTTGFRFGYQFTDATEEFTSAELIEKGANDELSNVSGWAHTNDKGSFEYMKSNRAFGGFVLGLQYRLDSAGK